MIGSTALTFSDLRKRLNPQGQLDTIMEVMAQSNPIKETFLQGIRQPSVRRTLTRNYGASMPA